MGGDDGDEDGDEDGDDDAPEDGEDEGKDDPSFEVTLKPVDPDDDGFDEKYKDQDSSDSKELWDNLEKAIKDELSDKAGVDASPSCDSWKTGSIIAQISISKDGDWTDEVI